ncbi:sensor histidine kinase [Streptomyces sp. NPDC001107]
METTLRNWLLPVLLAAGQIAWLWPGAGLAGAEPPGAAALVAVLGVVVAETAALGRRRQAPVRALAWSVGADLLGQLAWQDGYFGLGAPVALYSVAVRCPVPVTLRALAAAVGVEWLLSLIHLGVRPQLAAEWTLGALLYIVCAGLGEARRQWLKGRLLATRRLAGAQETRRRAGDTERRRLARELHDVSAHHLTSVVITADAARRLGDSRPELTAEALSFAERTGTETLTALQRLVGLLHDVDRPDPRPMTARIEELIAGFGRLGRPIDAVLPDDLAGPAAEAVHGIVREALTNALRHAPGSAVRVSVLRGEGVLELSVDNAPPRGSAPDGVGSVAGLGSGRGVAGMKERAEAVGGELTVGPAPRGGWRVRATLPDVTGPWGPAEGAGGTVAAWGAASICPRSLSGHRSVHGDVDRVPAGRSVGKRLVLRSCLHLAGLVDGADLQLVLAGLRLPRPAPLPPGVHRWHLRELCPLPGSAVHAHYELGSCGQSVQQQTQGFGGADDVRLGALESPQQGEEGYGGGGACAESLELGVVAMA